MSVCSCIASDPNEECILLYARNNNGSWLPVPVFVHLTPVQHHCHVCPTVIIVNDSQMYSRRDRDAASCAVQLLQQLSTAQDLETWCTTAQRAGRGCLAHASAKYVLPCMVRELELCI